MRWWRITLYSVRTVLQCPGLCCLPYNSLGHVDSIINGESLQHASECHGIGCCAHQVGRVRVLSQPLAVVIGVCRCTSSVAVVKQCLLVTDSLGPFKKELIACLPFPHTACIPHGPWP